MRRKWYNKRSKVDKSKGGEVDNGQEPVSSKRSSFDFAANKLFWGPSINDPSSDAAASSNELPNQPPPENHQTQDAGAEGLDPVQQEAYQKEMAKEKAKGIRRQRRIEQQVRFFDYCLEQCNNLIEEVSTEERRQIYERRLEEIRVTFPELFNDNRLQTTSATKYSLIFKSRLGRDQRDQVEINIRKVVRQLYKLTGEVIIQEGLEFKKLRASVKKLHTDAHELIQHIHESHTLWMQAQSCSDLTPENYNPYYSMKDVKDKERINIDSTLPGSVGIRAIRRVLSRLDIDIYKDATEQEVAKLAGHSEHKGTSMHNMQEAFKPFGIDYSYTREILTIHDIEKVTKCGRPILTHVYKEGKGIKGCFVTIEKVSWTQNGEPICTIYDPHDPNDQKIRQIPYRELQLVLSDHHLLPTKWRELVDTHEARSGS